MVAFVKQPSTLNEAYNVFGKEFVEGPGAVGIGRIADYYDESGNLIQRGGLSVAPSFSNEEVFEESIPFMMPVYNRQPYSNNYGIVNTDPGRSYLEFLKSLGIII